MPNTAEEQKQQTKKKYNRRIDILLALFLILAAGMSMFVLVWKEYALSPYPATESPTNLISPAVPTTPTSPTSPTSPAGSTTPTTPAGNQEIDTTDWLTYRNEEYGFELRYPKSWLVTNYNEDYTIYQKKGIGFRPLKFQEPVFFIKVILNSSEDFDNIVHYFETLYSDFSENSINAIYLSNEYYIGSYPTQLVVLKFPIGEIYYGVIKYNEYTYIFDLDFLFEKDPHPIPQSFFPLEPYREQLKTFLGTFKFLG